MGAKLLFVDVGTHEAQEYMGLFGHDRLAYLRRRLRHYRRSRRQGKTALDRAGFRNFLATAEALKSRRDRFI